jgi:death-on-curing protein
MPVLNVLGGRAGKGVIEGILALPRQSAGGKSAYPSVFDKAAVLFRSLVLDHPFVDGNKRMGVATALTFLWANDQVVSATDKELVDKAVVVAEGLSDWRELSKWFEARTLSMDEIADAVERDELDALTVRLPGRITIRRRPLLDVAVGYMRGDYEVST